MRRRLRSFSPLDLMVMGGGAAAGPLFKDTFTDANSTSLDAHTPDIGGAWTIRAGSIDIQSNKANIATAVGQPFTRATADMTAADYTLTIVITPQNVGEWQAGVVVRYGADGKFYYIALASLADELRLLEWNGVTLTSRDTDPLTLELTGSYTLVVAVTGSNITASVGAASVSWASATVNQTATLAGILGVTANVRMDDLTVNPT